MQTDSLRYFIALAHTGSFYKAARKVFISQQGLNKAVSAIEDELGVKLVERGPRGVRLTCAGETFLDYAEKAVALHDAMISDLMKPEVGGAAVADPIMVRATYYPVEVAAGIRGGALFSERTSVQETPFNEVLESVERARGDEIWVIDLHPYSRVLLERHRNLVFEPLIATQFGIVWREGTPPSSAQNLHREDVARLPLALNSHRDMRKLHEWLFRDHPLRSISLQAASPRLLLEYVRAAPGRYAGFDSLGFLISERDPAMNTEGLRFAPLSTPESVCTVGAIYDKRHRPNARLRHELENLKLFLRREFSAHFDLHPIEG